KRLLAEEFRGVNDTPLSWLASWTNAEGERFSQCSDNDAIAGVTGKMSSNGGRGRGVEFRGEGRMHILVAIVSALGIIGVILWRLHMAAEATKGLVETANDARGLFRRWRWQRKLASNPLDLIQDPREAAVAMMVAVAQSDGAMTDRERQVI